MNEKLDPEEVESIMRRLKDGAVRIVESHGGIVSQFVGDEVLALFGVPTAHEDDPLRAIRAGQEIHALARELSPEVEARIGQPLSMHTGINTGLVLTSNADARDGTVGVTGDTVNVGARLKAQAEDDTILLSPMTARLVDSFVRVEPLELTLFKGKVDPIKPYLVVGEAIEAASRFEAATARGLTTFAGRTEETATLRRALEQATGGEGQFVTVVGEPGVGKSRLAYEFRHSIDRDKVNVLEGRCQSYGADMPYLPFLDAMRRALHLADDDAPEVLHQKAVDNILAIDPVLERYLPHLLHLLSVPTNQYKLPEALEGEALRQELEEALLAAFTQNTRHGPMVVILEDWHWADEASDYALHHLTSLVGHHPLLLLILFRPEYTRSWGELEHHTAIVLKTLDVANTEAMLRSVLGADSLPDGLGEAVHGRTGGNALFNEEVARSLLEEGHVSVTDGAASLGQNIAELHLPETVHAVIRARVDRLPGEDREVLRLASVIGREFDREVLERIVARARQVGPALERLARQDLVQQVRVVPQAEYLFKHVLTQEVVYETLLISQRKKLHAKVGEALETLYPDRLEEHYEAIADHYSQSDNAEKAVEYLEKAGDKARSLYLISTFIAYYQSAIDILDKPGATKEDISRGCAMVLKLIATTVTSLSDDVIKLYDRFICLAREIGDLRSEVLITVHTGFVNFLQGRFVQAKDILENCIDKAERLGDEKTLLDAFGSLGTVCFFMPDFRLGLTYLDRMEQYIKPPRISQDIVWYPLHKGNCLAFIGRFDEGRSQVLSVRRPSEEMNNLYIIAWSFLWTGLHYVVQGQWDDAQSDLVEAVHFQTRVEDVSGVPYATGLLGYAMAMNGDTEMGIKKLSAVLQESPEDAGFALNALFALGAEVHALIGERSRSIELAETVLEKTTTEGSLMDSVAWRAKAIVAASESDWSEMVNRMQASFSIATEQQALPELATAHFRYAECLHKKGDLDAALGQLDQAERLLSDMGMAWWAEQAEGLRGRIDRGEAFVWFAPFVDGSPEIVA